MIRTLDLYQPESGSTYMEQDQTFFSSLYLLAVDSGRTPQLRDNVPKKIHRLASGRAH